MKRLIAVMVALAGSTAWAQGAPQVNENTGDLTYHYDFALPKARGRFQPSLSISYSSSSRASEGVGYGWSLSVPYIERDVAAAPKDASTPVRDQWWIVEGPSRTLLVQTSQAPLTYRPYVESSYLKVVWNASTAEFEATDGQGTVSRYRRLVTGQSRWYLASVTDLDGNVATYSYTPIQVGERPALLTITYNRKPDGTDATRVDLTWKADTQDPRRVNDAGVLVTQVRRLWRVSAAGPTGAMNHQLCYAKTEATCLAETSSTSGVGAGLAADDAVGAWHPRLLRRAYAYGKAAAATASLTSAGALFPPPTVFEYAGEASADAYALGAPIPGSRAGISFASPVQKISGINDISSFPALIDMDGDGRPDLVWGPGDSTTPANNQIGWQDVNQGTLFWARNVTPPGSSAVVFDGPQKLLAANGAVFDWTGWGNRVYDQSLRSTQVIRDFDGDGIPDIARTRSTIPPGGMTACGDALQVCLVKPTSLPPVAAGVAPVSSPALAVTTCTCAVMPPGQGAVVESWNSTWGDFNGDGLPDIARASLPSTAGSATPITPAETTASNDPWIWKLYQGTWRADGVLEFVYVGDAGKVPGGAWQRHQWNGVPSPVWSAPAGLFIGATDLALDLNGDGFLDSVEIRNGQSIDPAALYDVGVSTWGDLAGGFAVQELWNLKNSSQHPRYGAVSDGSNQCVPGNPNISCYPCPGDLTQTCQTDCSGLLKKDDGGSNLGAYLDLNGDGIPDLVFADAAGGSFSVSWGTGTGFTAPVSYLFLPATSYSGFYPYTQGGDPSAPTDICTYITPSWGISRQFIDLNADGVPDYIDGWRKQAFSVYPGSRASSIMRPYLMTAVVTSASARIAVTYGSSAAVPGGPTGLKPIVTALSVTGGHLPSGMGTQYAYAGWKPLPNWAATGHLESGGFADTWVKDVASSIISHTRWNTGAPTLAGRQVLTESGLGTFGLNPSPALSQVFSRAATTWALRDATSNTATGCFDGNFAGVATSPPLHAFQTQSDASTFHTSVAGTVEAWTRTSVACADVDALGNVLKQTVTPSITSPTTGAAAGTPVVAQTNLTGTTSCPAVPASIESIKKDALGTTLLHEVTLYDASCRPVEKYAVDEAKSTDPLKQKTKRSTTTYGAFGVPTTLSAEGVTKTLVYDTAEYLNVKEERSEDTLTALSTTYTFDPTTGLKLSAAGPCVVKANGVAQACGGAITRYYLYDALGRQLAVAKSPFSGTAAAGNTPAFSGGTGVVEAFEYLDAASPRAVRAFRFAQPKTLTAGTTAWQADADVMLTVNYADELGRALQQRERLGAGTTSATGRVTQGLNGWRVTKSAFYDAAGRVYAALEPFYAGSTGAAGEAYEDLTAAGAYAAQTRRVAYTQFDSRSRPTCAIVQPLVGPVPAVAPAVACQSVFSDDATHRLATLTRYGAQQVTSRGPYAGWFVTAEVVPPDQTEATKSGKGMIKLAGPLGEDLGAIDADGHKIWIVRDALQREIASWRESASGTLATLSPTGGDAKRVASTVAYNTAGQVIETWDMNLPDMFRRSVYDLWGRLQYLVINSRTGEGMEYTFAEGDLGRVTEVREATLSKVGEVWSSLTPKTVVQNHYDLPSALAPAGATYRFIAGKLSWTQVPTTGNAASAEPAATFYGYDDAGRIERRDQRFQRIEAGAKVFTVTSSYGGDGRVLDATYANGYGATLTHTVDYDSAGRPVAIAGSLAGVAASTFWQVGTPSGTATSTGGYDAQGRIPWIKADNGLVASVRQYSAFNGQQQCEWKSWAGSQVISTTCPAATPVIAGATGVTYEGTKVKGYADPVAQTSYANTYLPSGKLAQAKATPAGAIGSLTQDYQYDYTFSGIGNLESATEAENQATASQTAGRAKTSTVGAYTPVKASATEAKDKVASIEHKAGVAGPAALPAVGKTSYTYDIQGHLLTVTRNGVEAERLTYGPTGELLSRQAGAAFTFFVGEYMSVSATGQAGCTSTACVPQAATVQVDSHVLLAGTRIVSVKASRTLYYYRGRLGTVVATSLAGGTLGAQYRYDPYGRQQVGLGETASTSSELGYTNGLKLTGNLLYLKARVYDAEARVFLQADSVDRYRYAYVWGDPANLSDPTGLAPAGDGAVQNPVATMARAILSVWDDGIEFFKSTKAVRTGTTLAAAAVEQAEAIVALGGERQVTDDERDALTLMGYANGPRNGKAAPEGFERLEQYEKHDSKTGFDAAAFRRIRDGRVFGVFGGTRDGKDVSTDVNAGLLGNEGGQLFQARQFADRLKDSGNKDIMLAGHSLGGGLAAYAAAWTKLPAITANAMGIQDHLLPPGGDLWARACVRNFFVFPEVLSTSQFVGSVIGLGAPALGRQIPLSPRPGGFKAATSGYLYHGLEESVWPAVGIKEGL